MNKKTLEKLEYNKIIELLAEHASSFGGKEKCRRLKPSVDIARIRSSQAETAAAFTRIVRKGRPSFDGAAPVSDSLRRLEIGGVLGSGELLRICRLLETAGRVKSYGKQPSSNEALPLPKGSMHDGTPCGHENADTAGDCLDAYFSQLIPVFSLTSEIRRCIIEEDEISDDASANLKHIRRQIGQMNDRVHSTLSGMVNSNLRTYLQDALITMRGDRYCIPVKAEYRAQVPGLIHDQSATGSTLFIEPMAVVKLNNDLKELYGKEQEEIQAILSRLSSDAAEYIDSIRTDYTVLITLDFIFAKGALALEMNASCPVFNTEGRLHIRAGRHPLLDKNKVVPITITLGDGFDLLIITGPNTGGKTVSLKTAGLFCLMGQAGLHIPAFDRSELPVFTDIYADIGDEQSIEQSLSTFSSHMTNIVSFLKTVDKDSFVLFDELGAGTDPAEGAALAISILQYLHERGIRTMATTHYSELKVYALSTPGVENACCEFDVETLRPTYHLLIGIPGKSNAFAIAGKLGLPGHIIDDARSRLTEQEESFEELLTDLETSRRTMEKEQAEAAAYRLELEQLKAETEDKRKKLEEQRERILREAHEKAHAILAEAKETADETMRNFHKFGRESISAAEMEKEREKLRKKMENARQGMKQEPEKPKRAYKPEDFKPGEAVRVLSMKLNGTVSSVTDSKGYVTVQMGILRSQVHMSDLEIIEEKPSYLKKTARQAGKGRTGMMKALSVSPEINLLGKTVDEAVAELDKYLDDASLAHLTSVRIVHGKGTGALRSGIHNYLRRQKHVKSFRLGAFGEGDAGVTIAELK